MSESQFPETHYKEEEYIDKLLAEENIKSASASTDEPTKDDKSGKNTKLSLARVRAIMKMDPDVRLLSQESVFLVTRATEMFIKQLAKETYVYTEKAKRKTVQKRDLDAAIENIEALCFLEGTLEY